MSDTLPIFDLRTHRGTLDFPDQVNAYLSKELKLCRIAGPFDTVPLAQGLVVSPLNTVVKLACVAGWIRERASGGGAAILPRWRSPWTLHQTSHGVATRVHGFATKGKALAGEILPAAQAMVKRDSEERRVIVDLSWPCGHSVNDGIPSNSYFGELLVLRYPAIAAIDCIVDAVVTLGRGCHLYKRDLRKAYRQFPVDPKDYPFLGYTLGHFCFDTVLTMGLRSAAMACQRSTSAVAWIASQQDRLVFNYLLFWFSSAYHRL